MILMKNTPVPADVLNVTESPVNSFINQCSTGQITVEMTWELKKEDSKDGTLKCSTQITILGLRLWISHLTVLGSARLQGQLELDTFLTRPLSP